MFFRKRKEENDVMEAQETQEAQENSYIKENKGHCVICEKDTVFYSNNSWLRDHYICKNCHSIPRQRALIHAMNLFIPNWQDKVIHESSPGGVSSDYLKQKLNQSEIGKYTQSQFYHDVELGEFYNGTRCENLEKMTFQDDTFDVFITQDVFEHVLNPELAFKEINRVLKEQGIHIFTMPWYPNQETAFRVIQKDGKLEYPMEPIYHGNPIDDKGSIVTVDWGRDLVDYIYKASGMTTMVYLQIDDSLGLEAEFLHVFVSHKAKLN